MLLDILTLRDFLGPWLRQIVFILTLALPSGALCGMRPLVVAIDAWNLPERVSILWKLLRSLGEMSSLSRRRRRKTLGETPRDGLLSGVYGCSTGE
jgi:hypothetical protein